MVEKSDVLRAISYITDPVNGQVKGLSTSHITREVLDLKQRISIAWGRYLLNTKIREKILNPLEYYVLPLDSFWEKRKEKCRVLDKSDVEKIFDSSDEVE